MANVNYKGWSGKDIDTVYDAVGNKVTGPRAEAYLQWKKANKVGTGDVEGKGRTTYKSLETIAKERAVKEKAQKLNRFQAEKQKPLTKPSKNAWEVPQKYKKYFHHSAFNRNRAGRSPEWTKNLTLRGGKNPAYNWSRTQFDYKAKSGLMKTGRTGPKDLWGINIQGGGTLKDLKALIRQLEIASRAVYVQAEHFRVLTGERAIQVFRNSFKYKKFYTSNSTAWHPLSEFTKKKRMKRGTGTQILVEYRDLMDSFELEKESAPMTTTVQTGIVQADIAKHKKHSLCYAGWHNEGEGTYGNGFGRRAPKQYIKRQFMGHSSFLNPINDHFLRRMMKIYLFDGVFKVQK